MKKEMKKEMSSTPIKIKSKVEFFPKQQEVYDSVINDDYTYYCLNIGRGGGKTTLLEDIIFYYAILGRRVLVLSRTDAQLRDNNYNPFVERIENANFKMLKSYNKTYKEFHFKSGGFVKFKSGHKPDSVRGSNTYNVVIIDEFAHCHPDLWRELLQITKFKGITEKVILASTPNGFNHFHTAYIAELEDDNWKSFTYTSAENTRADAEVIRRDRLKIPEIQARQEYDAEFIEDGASAFSNVLSVCTLSKQSYNSSLRYFAGLDIALSNDYTVLTIFNNKGEMTDYLRFNKASTDIWLERIVSKLKEYKVQYLVAENNFESTLIQLLRNKAGCVIEEFRTSASNKNKLVEDLIVEVDLGRLKLLNDDLVRSEFSRFVEKKTATGHTYSAISGHDDIVMSCAMANKAVMNYKQGGVQYHRL